ncbi:MAG: EamA family transporter, partial [Oscillospiraceae bacterium]
MNNRQSVSRIVPDLLLILVALIWGSGFVVTNRAVLSGMPPSLILALRFLIPVLVMAVLFRGELVCADPQDLCFGATAGVLLFAAFLTQTYGLKF